MLLSLISFLVCSTTRYIRFKGVVVSSIEVCICNIYRCAVFGQNGVLAPENYQYIFECEIWADM